MRTVKKFHYNTHICVSQAVTDKIIVFYNYLAYACTYMCKVPDIGSVSPSPKAVF